MNIYFTTSGSAQGGPPKVTLNIFAKGEQRDNRLNHSTIRILFRNAAVGATFETKIIK